MIIWLIIFVFDVIEIIISFILFNDIAMQTDGFKYVRVVFALQFIDKIFKNHIESRDLCS